MDLELNFGTIFLVPCANLPVRLQEQACKPSQISMALGGEWVRVASERATVFLPSVAKFTGFVDIALEAKRITNVNHPADSLRNNDAHGMPPKKIVRGSCTTRFNMKWGSSRGKTSSSCRLHICGEKEARVASSKGRLEELHDALGATSGAHALAACFVFCICSNPGASAFNSQLKANSLCCYKSRSFCGTTNPCSKEAVVAPVCGHVPRISESGRINIFKACPRNSAICKPALHGKSLNYQE